MSSSDHKHVFSSEAGIIVSDCQSLYLLCGNPGCMATSGCSRCVESKWRSQGSNNARGNSARERVWFSPHCERTASLFALGGML